MDPDADSPVDLRGGRCQSPRETGIRTARTDAGAGPRERCERRGAPEAVTAVEPLRSRDLRPAAGKQVGAQRAAAGPTRPAASTASTRSRPAS